MPASVSDSRVCLSGKFFRLGGEKFHVKGVTYGPFKPNEQGEFFAGHDATQLDFDLILELGANLVRVYHAPPPVVPGSRATEWIEGAGRCALGQAGVLPRQ